VSKVKHALPISDRHPRRSRKGGETRADESPKARRSSRADGSGRISAGARREVARDNPPRLYDTGHRFFFFCLARNSLMLLRRPAALRFDISATIETIRTYCARLIYARGVRGVRVRENAYILSDYFIFTKSFRLLVSHTHMHTHTHTHTHTHHTHHTRVCIDNTAQWRNRRAFVHGSRARVIYFRAKYTPARFSSAATRRDRFRKRAN